MISNIKRFKTHHFRKLRNPAISKNPDQLAEVSAEVSASSAEVSAEVSASFAEVSAVHSQKLPRFTRGNLHEISNKFLRN